jgi:ABC-type branched-subunit amino acid transport system substrate-binding protein
VTPSSILIGAVLQDVAGAGKAGFGAAAGLSPDQQQSAYDAYFNAINAAGGINGRRVVGTYATVDISNPDSQRAACLTFTQDKKVFAVLAGPGFYNGAQCVASENRTPLVIGDSQGLPTEWVTQAGGLMATMFAASTRMMSTFVENLDGLGALRGRSIGIVSDESDAGRLARDTALLPALAQRGYSATYVTKLSADTATAATQVPIEVQKMRSAGVNTVLVLTNALYMVQFAQAASAQGFKPSYLVPDWGAASDAGYENMPADFDGTWISAVTTTDYNAGQPDSPAEASCRQTYESATGDHLTRENSGSALRMDFTLIACDLVATFTRAATAAGTNLTRATFANGLQSLGPFTLSYWGPGSFGDGKLEYSDAVRANRWSAGCKCWVPARPF